MLRGGDSWSTTICKGGVTNYRWGKFKVSISLVGLPANSKNIKTRWGLARPSPVLISYLGHFLFMSLFYCETVFLWGHPLVDLAYCKVIFHWDHPPVRSSCEVVFLWGCLPVRSSSCEVVFLWGCLPVNTFWLSPRTLFLHTGHRVVKWIYLVVSWWN